MLSDSNKKQNIYFLKKKKIHTFFVTKTKNSGIEVIAADSVSFYIFIYLKDSFILIPYSMGSFLRYNDTLFMFFSITENNLNFSENSEICICFIKIEEFVTNIRPNAY